MQRRKENFVMKYSQLRDKYHFFHAFKYDQKSER